MSEKKTLKQIFDEVFDEAIKNNIQMDLFDRLKLINRKWLQQKHPDLEIIDYTMTRDKRNLPKTNRFYYLRKDKLLEELDRK